MRTALIVGAAGAAFLAAGDIRAAGAAFQFELGARVGYDVPLGNVDGYHGDSLAQKMRDGVPLWVDAGVRPLPHWFFGFYAMYAPGRVGDAVAAPCNDEQLITCSTDDGRVGAEVHYHVLPAARWDPWLGLGMGIEWLHVHYAPQRDDWATGWELANFQAGFDVAFVPWAHVGPFVALSLAQFDTLSSNNCAGYCQQYAIRSKDFHGWLSVGARVVFDIGWRPAVASPSDDDIRWH